MAADNRDDKKLVIGEEDLPPADQASEESAPGSHPHNPAPQMPLPPIADARPQPTYINATGNAADKSKRTAAGLVGLLIVGGILFGLTRGPGSAELEAQAQAERTALAEECLDATEGATRAMQELHNRLSVGLTLDEYRTETLRVSNEVTYIRYPSNACEREVGQPLQELATLHVDAVHYWDDAFSNPWITSEEQSEGLQSRWSLTGELVAEIENGLIAIRDGTSRYLPDSAVPS